MDRADADPPALAHGLDDLRAVNRWLGGKRTAVALGLDLAARVPREPVQVLDVGTGAADIPLALVAAARTAGRRVRVTGLDAHPETVAYARKATAGDPDIEIVRGDALELPFPDSSFDIAMCNTMLHHFDPTDAARVLAGLNRVARFGVIVTDLARSRLALAGARVLAATVWRRHPITRHDGPISVRAAYTPDELRRLAETAVSDAPARVRREPVFRMSLVIDRASG